MFARSTLLAAPVFAILGSAAIASPAQAADMVTVTTTVRYHDLDLATPAGEDALRQRIARAAKNVCWQADGPTIDDQARFDACRTTAIASASPKMNAVIASARSDHRYAMNGDAVAMLGR